MRCGALHSRYLHMDGFFVLFFFVDLRGEKEGQDLGGRSVTPTRTTGTFDYK